MVTANKSATKSAFLPNGMGKSLQYRAIEFAGVGMIVLALGLLAAISSYTASDPSLNTATFSAEIKNLLGATGSVTSDFLLQTFGLVSLFAVCLLAGWGWRLVSSHRIDAYWLRLAILPLGFLSAALALSFVGTPDSWPLRGGLGGIIGDMLYFWALDLMLEPIPRWGYGFAITGISLGLLLYILGYTLGEWRYGARCLWRGCYLVVALMIRLRGRLSKEISTTNNSNVIETHRPSIFRQLHDLLKLRSLSSNSRERIEPTFGEGSDNLSVEVTEPRRMVNPDLVAPKGVGAKPSRRAKQPKLDLRSPDDGFHLPPLELIDDAPQSERSSESVNQEGLQQNARFLEGVLDDFGVRGEIVKVRPGPVVTLYELEPAPGTKTSRVIGLSDDIARSMSAVSVRSAVIRGRNVIGIELPNAKRETVYLRELLSSEAYEKAGGKLPMVLGKDIGGYPVITDLARMPHLLIAGTTGSGKSVGLNVMILSLLYRLKPDEGKLIMIDPKMLELSIYDDIPHLLTPVVTEPKKAVVALKWTVREMERRYSNMAKLGVRNIEGYNKRVKEATNKGEELTRTVQTGFDAETGKPIMEEQPLDLTPLPYIVVVVDEMADLMLVAGKDIEAAIQRLAQMARAAGIHLIMATQRPSVDVVTGTIKANFPTRISFQVTSKVDSRTILGEQGAEQLLGQGDMLYMAGGGRITRVHGPLVHDDEVEAVAQYLRSQGEPEYVDSVTADEGDDPFLAITDGKADDSSDELYDKAIAIVCREGKASTSFVQRHLQIGYNRAARIIEKMEKEGVISSADRVGRREVLASDHSE
ncbi:MAG: DNA translocase FtsK 4TM domain-containing protein [Pseudomonadota bacterium]|nr:DNA translocase FtsK 4TM domain-containing protein [Pseudomonadota bacterium]